MCQLETETEYFEKLISAVDRAESGTGTAEDSSHCAGFSQGKRPKFPIEKVNTACKMQIHLATNNVLYKRVQLVSIKNLCLTIYQISHPQK